MVSVHDDRENEFIWSLAKDTFKSHNEYIILGAIFNGTNFNWIDGTEFNYANYDDKNNKPEVHDFIALSSKTGKWFIKKSHHSENKKNYMQLCDLVGEDAITINKTDTSDEVSRNMINLLEKFESEISEKINGLLIKFYLENDLNMTVKHNEFLESIVNQTYMMEVLDNKINVNHNLTNVKLENLHNLTAEVFSQLSSILELQQNLTSELSHEWDEIINSNKSLLTDEELIEHLKCLSANMTNVIGKVDTILGENVNILKFTSTILDKQNRLSKSSDSQFDQVVSLSYFLKNFTEDFALKYRDIDFKIDLLNSYHHDLNSSNLVKFVLNLVERTVEKSQSENRVEMNTHFNNFNAQMSNLTDLWRVSTGRIEDLLKMGLDSSKVVEKIKDMKLSLDRDMMSIQTRLIDHLSSETQAKKSKDKLYNELRDLINKTVFETENRLNSKINILLNHTMNQETSSQETHTQEYNGFDIIEWISKRFTLIILSSLICISFLVNLVMMCFMYSAIRSIKRGSYFTDPFELKGMRSTYKRNPILYDNMYEECR